MVFIEHELSRLNASYGNINEVLIVKLNDETRLSDFVLLINIANKVKFKNYAYAGDDFYFFGIEKPVEDKSTKVEVYSITCGYIPFVQEKPHPEFYDVFFAWFRKTFQKENAWWLAGYLLLIFIPSIVSTKIVRKIPLKNL